MRRSFAPLVLVAVLVFGYACIRLVRRLDITLISLQPQKCGNGGIHCDFPGLMDDALWSSGITDSDNSAHIGTTGDNRTALLQDRRDADKNDDSGYYYDSDNNITTQKYSHKSCSPQDTVYFLRIHKTGSSTLTNIMYMYMLRHNLSVVPVRVEGIYPGSYVKDFHLVLPKGHQARYGAYNYLGDHVVYNQSDVSRVLSPNAVNIALVRYPLAQLRSIFKEWSIAKKLNIIDQDPVETYLRHYQKYADYLPEMLHNLMSRSFAVNNSSGNEPEEHFFHRLKDVDRYFRLVMVNEYYDESLVLLRRKLCWDVRDIIHINKKTNPYRYTPKLLQWDLELKHRNISMQDYWLYKFYAAKLMAHIQKEPEFWSELSRFRIIQKQVEGFCTPVIAKISINPDVIYTLAEHPGYLYIDARPFGSPFNVSEVDCALMNLQVMAFRRILLVRENPEYCQRPVVDQAFVKQRTCSGIHPVYGVPLGVLARTNSYS